MNSNVNVFSAVVISLFTGGGFYTVVLFVMNWRGRKTEAARIAAAAEKDQADARKSEQDAKNAETERLRMIADLEKRAHDTAEAVAERKYGALEKEYGRVDKQCNTCLRELDAVKEHMAKQAREHRVELDKRDKTMDTVLDALTELVPLIQADGPATEMLRAAIRHMRQSRYDY